MDKGLQYLQNIVKVETELYLKLKEYLTEDSFTTYTGMLVNTGIGESIFRIKEAQKAAKQIFGEELEVIEDIQQHLKMLKPSFYVKDNQLFTSNNIPFEEAVKLTETFLKQKETTKE